MVNGLLNIYKPQNISSNSVVIKVKKILGIKKVGHTGTLDPLACGVLPICIGSATKISEYLLNKDKVYKVKLKFGVLTDTFDCEGKVIREDKDFKSNESEIIKVLQNFVGEYDQVPPNYSALKINGQRAYELARKGIEFSLKARKIKIHYINEIKINGDECSFTVKCSKGTYIRSLCRDIGDRLNTCATMTFLERIESGIFKKESSIMFDDLTIEKIQDNIIGIDKVIPIPKLEIHEEEFFKLLINGVCIKNPRYINNIDEGEYLISYKDQIKGICRRKLNFLKMTKNLN